MDEDTLDPAFADFDVSGPSLASFNDFDSLGAGSSAAYDFLDHQSEFSHDLNFEQDEDSSHVLGTQRRDDDDSTGHGSSAQRPKRRTVTDDDAAIKEGRLSLAFELSSISSMGNNGMDLMSELGLVEEEEGGSVIGDAGRDQYQHNSSEARDAVRNPALAKDVVDHVPGRLNRIPSPSTSPHRLASPMHPTMPNDLEMVSHVTLDANDADTTSVNAFAEDEIEGAFVDTVAAIQESITLNTTFLQRIHSLHRLPLAPSSADRRRLGSHLPSSAGSASTTPALSRTDPTHLPDVELLASALVKSVDAASRSRDLQVRDVTDLERRFSRNDASWDAILAELDPLPGDMDESAGRITRDGSEHEDGATDSRPTVSLAQELEHLRSLTTAFLSALGSVSDASQVQSVLAIDMGRKVRALRTQVTTIKDDLAHLDQSIQFVTEFENQSRLRGRRNFAEEAREVMAGMENEFESVESRIRSVLSVKT
ncbi:uncharacterized protein JCM15063_004830 [Sporobolomyces koalae]|uniref:uncharacterized protein n=1 Tax=Sporobolomyces koalae TaxID=500713 RepID=UPI00316F00D2